MVRGIAVTGDRRFPSFPDLPTLAEAGVPGYAASSWQSLQAPASTPPDIVAQLAAAATAALAEPAVQARYADAGVEPLAGDPAEATRFIRAETAKWGPILRATGARAG